MSSRPTKNTQKILFFYSSVFCYYVIIIDAFKSHFQKLHNFSSDYLLNFNSNQGEPGIYIYKWQVLT